MDVNTLTQIADVILDNQTVIHSNPQNLTVSMQFNDPALCTTVEQYFAGAVRTPADDNTVDTTFSTNDTAHPPIRLQFQSSNAFAFLNRMSCCIHHRHTHFHDILQQQQGRFGESWEDMNAESLEDEDNDGENALMYGKIVSLTGLTKAAQYNGRVAQIRCAGPAEDSQGHQRLKVVLVDDLTKVLNVKVDNVVAL